MRVSFSWRAQDHRELVFCDDLDLNEFWEVSVLGWATLVGPFAQ